MAHPITEKLEKLDPPLAPDASIEIYISGVHKKGPEGHLIHAFGLVFRLSDGRKALPVCSISEDHETTNDRAELAATLTAFEWLELNAHHSNSITILPASEYIHKHLPMQITKWTTSRDAENLDLLDQILPYYRSWPEVKWRGAKLGPDPTLHKRAKQMANRAIDERHVTAGITEDVADYVSDAFISIDDEFWMQTALDRDPY